jgi:hypothetical protein
MHRYIVKEQNDRPRPLGVRRRDERDGFDRNLKAIDPQFELGRLEILDGDASIVHRNDVDVQQRRDIH